MTSPVEKKSALLLGGAVRLPEKFDMPVRVSHSIAGPGAGMDSAAFRFGGMRVKKALVRDGGEFELHVRDGGSMYLTRGGEPFIDEIEFEPVVYHCPRQAFFTLDPRCCYSCAFCASPRLKGDKTGFSDEEIARRSLEAYETVGIDAVSLTSGVTESGVEATVWRFVSCIRKVREVLPGVPIGVEPYVETREQVRRLKDAGADEIKLNIQAATEDIFERVCPDLDRDTVLYRLKDAVEIFGRGRVSSNLIFGFGESDDDIGECMEMLCSMGVIPTVRSLRTGPYNSAGLRAAIGEPEEVTSDRLLKVAEMQKRILQRHGMDTLCSRTMCLECTCCDIVPFRDLRSSS